MMTRLSIELPDDVRSKLVERAARGGHASVEAFVQALLRAEADETVDDDDGPPGLSFRSEAELEAMLLARLDDDAGEIEVTPEFWDNLQREIQERRRKGA